MEKRPEGYGFDSRWGSQDIFFLRIRLENASSIHLSLILLFDKRHISILLQHQGQRENSIEN